MYTHLYLTWCILSSHLCKILLVLDLPECKCCASWGMSILWLKIHIQMEYGHNIPWFETFPLFNIQLYWSHVNNLKVKYSPFKIFLSLVFKSNIPPQYTSVGGFTVSRNKSLHDFASCIALQCTFTVNINLLQSRSVVPIPHWTIINSSTDETNQQ